MKLKFLLVLCLLFTGSISRAQTKSYSDSLNAAIRQAVKSHVDSVVQPQMDLMWQMFAPEKLIKSQYINLRAKALDADAQLVYDWVDSLAGTQVVEVTNTSSNLSTAQMHEAGLQSYVTIRLNKPAPWLRDPRWRSDVCLNINGLPLPEIRPLFFNNDSMFTFYLERGDSAANQITWDIIQQIVQKKITRNVKLSIGTPLLPALPVQKDKATDFTFIIIYKLGLIAFFIVAGGMIYLLYRFRKSQLFRSTDNAVGVRTDNGAYSLAKVQLAFWTVIIILCETYIWCITGVLPDLSTSSLILLGLSVGTTALSTAVGYANEIKGQTSSGSFWKDIISDAAGVPSLHRVQMVIWTLLIGFYFVRESWLHFSMPDISENLLILMGISSGTYVAFKTQERKAIPVANASQPLQNEVPATNDTVADDDEPAVG
jgi:hypothetical protein